MRAKYFKGNAYGIDFTSKEQKALEKEISRQIIERDRKHTNDLDAVVLFTLHTRFGFGKKRLREFWDAMHEEHERMIKHYEMPDQFTWLCQHKLKDIGVDVAAWNAEVEEQ